MNDTEGPAFTPDVMASLGEDFINMYAAIGPNGFFVRTIDTNKLVVFHDGKVMSFYDPAGVVVYTIDYTSEQEVVDENIDLVMDTAWGMDTFSNDLHVVLENVMASLGEIMDSLEREDGE